MALVPIEELPDHSRVWIFPSTVPIEESERGRLAREIAAFLETWAAHGSNIPAAWSIVDDRFVVVAADESASPSGCSIDRLFRFMRSAGEAAGTDFLDSTSIYHRGEGDEPVRTDRVTFQRLAETGAVTGQTEVYDTLSESLGTFRRAFVKRAADSWHGQLLSRLEVRG